MLDTCHSGAVAEGLQFARTDDLARDLTGDDCGVIIMCSSQGREFSNESTETRAGFFTHSVVEGLSGRADFNHDKIIQIHELERYTAQRVRELSRGTQNPVMGRPPGIESFPLARP